MTKRRDPMSYENAVAVVGDLLGYSACAAICGVTERSVRNWSDPEAKTKIRLIDAERLDREFAARGFDFSPFHRLYSLRIAQPARPADVDAFRDILPALSQQFGATLASCIVAGDEFDNQRRKDEARKELVDAICMLQDCLASLGGGNA